MSISITRVPDSYDVWGKTTVQPVDILFDNSYPANGYLVNAQDVGLKYITGGFVSGGNSVSGKVEVVVSLTTATTAAVRPPQSSVRLRIYFPTGGAGTSPSTLIPPVGITAPGAVAVTADADDAAVILTPGVAKEVATGTDLSTILSRITFFGL